MAETVPDKDVDAIVVAPTPSDHPTRSVGAFSGPPSTDVLIDVLDTFGWRILLSMLEAVLRRSSFDYNGVGFRYPTDEPDPGEEPFEDVRVYNPVCEDSVTIPAFEHLLVRYVDALITGAEATHDSVLKEPWWPEFVSLADQVRRRVTSAR